MIRKQHLALATTFFTFNSLASGNYVIQKGDTLSEIAARNIQGKRVYGRNGGLELLIRENTKIKNPNKIFPSQLIYIPGSLSIATPETQTETTQTTSAEEQKPSESQPETIAQNKPEEVHPLKLGAFFLYGPRYSSLTQTKQLGGSEVAVLSFQAAKLGLKFHKNNFSGYTTAETYKFKTKQLYTYEVVGGWKSFLLGLGREEQPVYENRASVNKISKQALTYLSVGMKKTWLLEEAKSKQLQLRGFYNHPLSMNTQQSGLTVDSVSGFGLKGTADYSIEIAKRTNHSWHFNWQTDLSYWDVSQETKWNGVSGNVDTKLVGLSTMAGILLKH